jgi:GNAT superfamily N-acetyltransferase
MKLIAAGWETDLSILRHSGSLIEEFDDHIVIRSPHNPDYHWGNFVLVTKPETAGDAARWKNTFHKAFPNAGWLAIGLPKFPSATVSWDQFGIELERMEVLKATTQPSSPAISPSYTSRILSGSDWDALLEREIEENLKSGEHDSEAYERFIRRSIEGYKDLCNRGLAAWFGAFSGKELVADLGIVVCGDTARYQSVQTDERHRRQGLASHLLGKAADWAGQNGCTSWVIVTESTNDAGRVYRGAGFVPDLETVAAYQAPPVQLNEDSSAT